MKRSLIVLLILALISCTVNNQYDCDNCINRSQVDSLIQVAISELPGTDTGLMEQIAQAKYDDWIPDTIHKNIVINTIDSISRIVRDTLYITTLDTIYRTVIISETSNNDKSGCYYITDFGAVRNDGIDDAPAINAAIEAAYNNKVGYFNGGVVVIPTFGVWNIKSPIKIRSGVELRVIGKAAMRIPNGYSGAVITNKKGEICMDWKIIGGDWFQEGNSRSATFIDFDFTNGDYGMRGTLRDMFIQRMNIGIDVYTENRGWLNGITIDNVWFWWNKEDIVHNEGPRSAGIDGWYMSPIFNQAGADTKLAFDLSGSYNYITSFPWDYGWETTPENVAILQSTSSQNQLNIVSSYNENFGGIVDNGVYNLIKDKNQKLKLVSVDFEPFHYPPNANTGTVYFNSITGRWQGYVNGTWVNFVTE